MASLRGDFEHFYPVGEAVVEKAIQTGLVALDTNVLLTLYRWQGEGRNQLFGALEKLDDRLWIPHQVALEFQRRRLDVIAEKEKYLKSTQRDLNDAIKGLRDWVEEFGAKIGLDQGRIKGMAESVTSLQKLLTAEVTDAKRASDVSLKDRDSDPVLAKLEGLLDDRVGEQMEPRVLKAARKEARRRVAERIPPGYEDAGKADPTGDYLIFRQLMDEAKTGERPVVFVTDDEKPDWYRRTGDIYLGARPELRAEMMTEAGVPFVIMTTRDFLLNAEKHLGAEVSPETVDQAKELPGIVDRDFRTRLALLPWIIHETPTDLNAEDVIRAHLARSDSLLFGPLSEATRKQIEETTSTFARRSLLQALSQWHAAEPSPPEDEEPSSPEE